MGDPLVYHRPLMAGVKINSQGSGTLSGIATSNSDGQPMLVTSLQVMLGNSFPHASGSEKMYQIDVDEPGHQVGTLHRRVPVDTGLMPLPPPGNPADVAVVRLAPQVDVESDLSFSLHSQNHNHWHQGPRV